jgi:hypothetical protein
MQGATPVSTEFDVAPTVPAGLYSLEVVANGIASDPVPFTQPASGTWTNIGFGTIGSAGIPQLAGVGDQYAGHATSVNLSFARPSSLATLFVGTTNSPTPFKGGFLVPIPALALVVLATDSLGNLSLPFAWPTGLPSGFSLFWQYAISDPFPPKGVTMSLALQSTTP